MSQKKGNSRKTSALSPKGLLKKHVIKKNVAIHIKNYLLLILFFQAALLIVVLFIADFALKEREALKSAREKEYIYWSTVAGQFPNKPDILFNASKSAYENGKKEQALIYVEKALQIDPLFEKAQKLLVVIGD